jgi:CRISPR-associated protein Cmr3
MAIFLEPLDVWVFRDGRPFSAGEDHHAKSVFPPSPFTVQGALRSKVLIERCGNLDKYAGRNGGASCPVCGGAPECPIRQEIGTPGHAGPFHLRYVLPAKRTDSALTVYFPLPRHLVRVKGEERWQLLQPLESPGMTSLPTGLRSLSTIGAKPVEHPDGWIDDMTLKNLLWNELPEGLKVIGTRGENGILEEEPRVGIALQHKRKSAESGRFFIVDALRLRDDWGLAIGFEGLPSLPQRGLLDIGGEGRAARYETIQEMAWPPAQRAEIVQARRFLLYFVSPALFSSGASRWTWKPSFLGSDLTGTLPYTQTRIRLVAAAIGSPLRISGWELGAGGRGGQPRPMRSAVPAGSVYFFEIMDGPVEPVLAQHGHAITDWGAEYGFGLTLVGRW